MKKVQNQLELVASFLSEQTTLSLATYGHGGGVSVAPLFYIVDKALSLYWLSSESCQHSLNLKTTPRVAATVYRDAVNWKEIRGLQMCGCASKVTEPGLRNELIEAYCKRFKLGRVLRLAARQSTLYAFQPKFFRHIDNAKGFGYNFELTLGSDGWRPGRP